MKLRALLAGAAALLVPALLASSTTAATPHAAVSDLAPLDIEITGIEPLVLVEGDTAVITARLENRSQDTLTEVSVLLTAQGWTANSRSTLVRWLDGDSYDPAIYLGSEGYDELAPGARITVRFEVPAEDFQFNTWGPRGIELTASAADTTSDRERSFVLWWNEPTVESTSVSVVAPVAQTARELSSLSTERVDELLAADPVPGLTLITDSTLAGAFTSGAVLPEFNADPEGLLTAAPEEYTAAVEAAAATGRPVVTWLGAPSEELLATGADLGDVVLVPSSAVSLDSETTPNAVLRTEPTTLAMIDDELSQLLAGSTTVDETTYELNAVEQRQLLAALTAVIGRERPWAGGRSIIASLPSTWSPESTAVLSVLSDAPWVVPVSLEAALESEPSTASATLPTTAELPEGTSVEGVPEKIHEMQGIIADLATLAPDVAERTASASERLNQLVSRAYREDPDARERSFNEAQWLVDFYLTGIAVAGPSSINMISTESEFPVNVTNSLAHDVDVKVSLTPSDPRLQILDDVEATLPAGQTVRVMVPVAGVGWGDFDVSARVLTTSGRDLTAAFPIDVRLRANWEDTGLIAIVAVAVAALAFGIFRTVQRNRKMGRSEIIDAAAEELDEILEAERGETK